ncbi:MAG: F0F1 ATP synthase subunit A [Bacteroidales bacterium]|nr:F0F1 ATP synthase subunit A [Bacteroidales bacterium]
MKKTSHKRSGIFRNVFLASAIIIFLVMQVFATNHGSNDQQGHGENWEDKTIADEFKAGDMIVEHIVDAHEWHILSYGDFHLTLPLPVILWYDGNLHTFMSSKFHHGHDDHNGFGLSQEGEHKGKIVRTLQERFITEHVITHDPNQKLPLDFSITKNVLAIFLSLILMSWIFISIAKAYRRREGEAPKGIQSLLEPLILFIRDDVAKASIGEKKYEKYMPFLLTLFFFIFLNNLLGLVPFFPGGANVTGNIAVTMVLALFTFVITTFSANKAYWVHIVNTPGVPWWLKFPVPLMPVVELIGVFTKPFVLMVRLFANMTAGHIIVLGFISLIFIFGQISPALGLGVSVVSIAFTIFMDMLELLVAFIQAYVFTLLSALYFGMATEEHH